MNQAKIKEKIGDLKEELDCYEDENYEFDDNLDYQLNGTYKYMNINVFRKTYNVEKLQVKPVMNKYSLGEKPFSLSLGEKITSLIAGGFIGGILAATLRGLIYGSNIRDVWTEAVGVLLGAVIIGPLIIRYLERNQ